MSSIASRAAQFAWSLFGVISANHSDENVFFSPASVQVALAMVMAGAKSDTHSELCTSLQLDKLDSPHTEVSNLISAINSVRSGVKLAVANRLFGDRTLAIEGEFSECMSKSYGAELGRVDFQEQWESARNEINIWVEQQTNSKIKELLARGNVDSSTRLVLVNAIYFKGDWEHPFKKEATQDSQFESGPSISTTVRMMRQSRRFSYAEGRGLRIVTLPFAGESCSMLIALPQQRHGLGDALKGVKELQEILDLAASGCSHEIDLHVPRFKIETQYSLDEPHYLPALGIRRIFRPGDADLSGISRAEDLCVSKVVHKAFLEVNEEGAEAAAATAVMMLRCAARPPSRIPFHVTEPFLVLIKDETTSTVLFAGRVNQPKE